MSRAVTLTRHLKQYDRDLFASLEVHPELSDKVIYVCRHNAARPHEPYFIFALTDDWTAKGKPRDWGIEVVMNRIRAIDLWKNETVVDRLMKDYTKQAESDDRAMRNSMESFLYEFRRDFAKATNHINTANLGKLDNRRIKEQRRI